MTQSYNQRFKVYFMNKKDDMKAWRRAIHSNPETAFEEFETADFIAQKLEDFGVDELHRNIGQTGIVAVINGHEITDDAIALRADMDALHIHEENTFDHKSKNPGKMHACGHDGHTAMLLGAAKKLCDTRHFKGKAILIFQPAEENEGGGRAMVEDGLFTRFPAKAVYGMHNWPGIEAGVFAVKPGPIMAANDRFEIKITGKGGHAAMPHLTIDPIPVGAQIVSALQTLVSRRCDPQRSAVISITQFHAGDTFNVIPEQAYLTGTLRTFEPELRTFLIDEIEKLIKGICEANNTSYEFIFNSGYPATINTADEANKAKQAMITTVGADKIIENFDPSMGSEDFSFMLQELPGAYVWIGNGLAEGGCLLHNPKYDFNDDILEIGSNYWLNLVEQELN